MKQLICLFLIIGIAGMVVVFSEAQQVSSEREAGEASERTSLPEKVHQGNLFFSKGNLEEALLHYQEALKGAFGENEAKVRYNLANTLARLGRFEEAEEEYKRTLRIDPEGKDTKYNLEVTYSAKTGKEGILRPQVEIEGTSKLDQEILQLLQTLERQEFDFPKGVPQSQQPPQPPTKEQRKDW